MNKKVMVVDDDIGVQETLEAILEFEGYAVTSARDGIEALTLLERESFSLILLDLMMPRMDGYAFVQELKARGLRSAVPILILTADGRAKHKAEAIEADGYVAKPFELVNLLDEVARLVASANT